MTKKKQDKPAQASKDSLKVDASQFQGEAPAAGDLGQEAPLKAAANQGSGSDAVVADLRKQVHDLEVAVQDNKNKALYHLAECQNVRDRASRDVENAHRYGTEKLLRELLPVLDSLERGMEECQSDDEMVKTLHHGMELTHKMFLQALEKFGVEQVCPLGEAFNPDRHEAISMKEDKAPQANTVVEVLQKGYVLNERLVRPALVVVVK